MYYEGRSSWGQQAKRSAVPTGVAVFADDFSVRSLVEREHTVTPWSEFDKGGHFAAMETPDLLVGDIRKFFPACAELRQLTGRVRCSTVERLTRHRLHSNPGHAPGFRPLGPQPVNPSIHRLQSRKLLFDAD